MDNFWVAELGYIHSLDRGGETFYNLELFTRGRGSYCGYVSSNQLTALHLILQSLGLALIEKKPPDYQQAYPIEVWTTHDKNKQ